MEESVKNPAAIITEVEYKYGLKLGTLASRDVRKLVSQARREAILRLRVLGLSWAHIGEFLGKRDHSGVMRLVAGEKHVGNVGKASGKHVEKLGTKKAKVKQKK